MEIPQNSAPPQSDQSEVVFDFTKVKKQVDQLISDWKAVVNTGGVSITDTGSTLGATSDQFKGEEVTSRIRRELRRDNRDLPMMRARGEISPDENYIPQRVIDQQISQEKPSQIAFIEQPERVLIFKDLTDPEAPTESIERTFTDHARFPGWTIPWHRGFDAVDLHGGVCFEVKINPDKPGYFEIEYIRREDLIFATEATDIQANEYIARRYRYMPFEVEAFVKKYNFKPEAVAEVLKNLEEKRHQKIEIFKCYCKRDSVVYIFWYSTQCQTSFLKDPEPYTLGLVDPNAAQQYLDSVTMYQKLGAAAQAGDQTAAIATSLTPPPELPTGLPEENYPIFFMPYEVIEDDRLLASKGLAFRYKSDQEILTQLWTSLLNAAGRAANIYASYANNPNDQGGLKNEKLIPNTVMGREAKFWNFPFPSADLLATATQYGSQVAAKSSAVDYAVNARDDSRKTAREIEAAQQQASNQKGVNLSGQSLTVLHIYELCWKIFRNYALLGLIKTANVDRDTLLHKYSLAAAGDSDVMRREARKQVIRETMQYVVNTPVANAFMVYLIKTFFPEEAKAWVPIVEAGDPANLINGALSILQTVPRDSLSSLQSSQLDQFCAQLNQYLATRGGSVPNRAPNVAATSANTTPNNLPKEQGGSSSGASS